VFDSLGRYLESQLRDKGRPVDLPLCGKFIKRKTQDDSEYLYVPSLEFLDAGHFLFP
jgi:hypothetical protein